MQEEQLRQIIREEIAAFMKFDRFVLDKHMQILDGRNIVAGRGTGTKIGTATDQKIGFYGKTPLIQAGTIASPTAPSATYVQAEATSAKTAIDAIILVLKNIGITA